MTSAAVADTRVRPSELESGGLLIKEIAESGDGNVPNYSRAVVLETNVDMAINGPFARVTVRQRFRNDGTAFVEGVYVFPLPENAAVDQLRMQIGERFIEGIVKERGEARRVYEQARIEGRRASLLEQERPNIFTASVANIGPGETVIVEIEYQETLAFRDGAFSIRFPMVVGPRYIPLRRDVVEIGDRGWSVTATPVADADRITPPVLNPDAGPINPVHVSAVLNAGFPLAALDSSYHAIVTHTLPDDRIEIALAEAEIPADRDFVLTWRPEIGAAPRAGLFTQTRDGQTYVLLMLVPSKGESAIASPPREVIFVIDTSGSMEGESIRQARVALTMALDRLDASDRFNIIQFNSTTDALFNSARPATFDALSRARRYIGRLEAEGGTEMLPALRAALSGTGEPGYFRQVIFLTDGAIGNEDALFETIVARLGDTRLFTVGIGSAPNGHFMSKAAELGRGTFTYIGKVEEVTEKMTALLTKLERPALTDIEISWPGGEAEAYPTQVPDLYHGEPIVVAVKGVAATGPITVVGQQGETAWRTDLDLAGAAGADGVAVVWARRRIGALIDGLHSGDDADTVRQAVIETALAHHLVSRYTSLVAIDVTPVRPLDQPLDTVDLPTNLPFGWDFDAVFGSDEAGFGTPDQPRSRLQRASLRAASVTTTASFSVPQTATPAMLQLWLGLLLIGLGCVVIVVRRRAV